MRFLVQATTLIFALTIPLHGVQVESAAPSVITLDAIRERALEGLALSLNDRFRSADSMLVELSESAPLSPLGPLFAAGNLQAEMIDTESDALRQRFLDRVNLAQTRVEAAISLRGASVAEEEFVLGVIAGYRAVYESRWGGWFAALKGGLRAKKHFERAIKLDSTMCDAYLGLGSYNFWKSAKTDWVNWLPVVSDSRNKGISMLERATQCGVYTRATAHAALASAFFHDGRYHEALAQADTLARLAPGGKAHLWLRARAHYSLYEWDSATHAFDLLEARIRADGKGNYFNLIECAYYRAQCHWGAGRYEQALNECGRALTYPAPDDIKVRQRKHLNELRTLQRKLLRLLAKG
jgi:tetratricopeptide (TPR) repeat protein